MDSKNKDEDSLNLEQCFHQDATDYTVNYSHGRKTEEVNNLFLHFLIPIAYIHWWRQCVHIYRQFMIKLRISTRRGRCMFHLSVTSCFFSVIWISQQMLEYFYPSTDVQFALATTQAEWSVWCRVKGSPTTLWPGGSSRGRLLLLQTTMGNRRYLPRTLRSSQSSPVTGGGLVTLIWIRMAAVYSARSDTSQL